MATFLYNRDSKGKIRTFIASVFKGPDGYIITRKTGLLDGKLTEQPRLEVNKGKVKRTVEEQAKLEFLSIVNSQRNKGYKPLQEIGGTSDIAMDYNAIDKLLPTLNTDTNGALKPMLAKDMPKKRDLLFKDDKTWLCSKKLDGVRVSMYLENGVVKTNSRGGKTYDAACTKILQNPKILEIFKMLGEDVILDGEIYIHGESLQAISGACRKQEYIPERHDKLEFWLFDYGDHETICRHRIGKINALHYTYQDTNETDNVKIVKHIEYSIEKIIKDQHDVWVLDGYEGLIMRDPEALYGFDVRDWRMVKMKEFQDDEFQIIGIEEGLRAEDMVFKCITKTGVEFKAKPIGSRETKWNYLENQEKLIGKMVTVKFFYYTPDGVPFLPVAKAIRDYE